MNTLFSLVVSTRNCLRAVLLLALALNTGCIRGHIYQDITVPYAVDVDNTPLGDLQGQASAYRLQEPVSGFNFSVEWNSYGFGHAYGQGKLARAFIADLRIQSAFFGVWRRNTLIVNGQSFALKEGALESLSTP